MSFFRRLALTASYVTCLPIYKLNLEESDDMLSGLSKYLPSVGLLIGICLFLGAKVLEVVHAPYLVQGVVLTVLWFVFTSGLHLDGLMDAADGIFSHQSPARMLEIMQDPRVGNFGVIVGILLLLSKFSALSSLGGNALFASLFLIPAFARLAEVYAIGKFNYLREQGKGKIWHDTTDYPRDLWMSAFLPVACTIGVLYKINSLVFLAVPAATLLGGIVCARWLNKKLGGHTGDTYGATVEVAEAAGLLVSAIVQCAHF
ncbi:MAG: adenosylcobinamide-GDP ribazoletransferase [Cyanobacteria bacterium SZAS-4]|nr:adenosylcobinamide-GDP ribazoletransferase [Cyanobacteria bacterium SZAS-4]